MTAVIFFSILVIDQVSKVWAHAVGKSVLNTGISFAWFEQVPAPVVTLAIVLIAVVIAIKGKEVWMRHQIVAAIFWGGVVSNLIDRILLGGVTDWLAVPFVPFKNNLADVAIGMGILLLLGLLAEERYEH
jgi:lipoprotein signal peptidase